jgi:hypothetical protein
MTRPSGPDGGLDPDAASEGAWRPTTGRRGWRRLIVAGLLGAVGVGGLLLIPGDPSASWCQVSSNVLHARRLGWLATACFAAVLIRPDPRGLLAAWLGALAASFVAVPQYLSHSPTTAGSPFWIGLSTVSVAVQVAIGLGLAFGVIRIVRSVAPPERARRIILAILGFMILATVLVLVVEDMPALAPALCVPWPQPAPAAPVP